MARTYPPFPYDPSKNRCPHCQATATMKLIYGFEGAFQRPYICTNCKKDEYGNQLERIPDNITDYEAMTATGE